MTVQLTEALIAFIRETPAASIPQEALDKASACIVDTVGCILAGSNSEMLEPLAHYLADSEEAGPHVVAGTSVRTSAARAALANGSFGHALDFDDVLSMMPAHPSTVVLPALFVALREATTGAEILDAYAIGVEVGAKIGLGISNAHYRRGFHATGTLAIFSAVAALCRLMKLDEPVMRAAFGIAASMASGVRCNFGTMTKPFHAGWAAHNAVIAVRLARCGMTAHPSALEAKAGFVEAYGTEQSDMSRTVAALAKPFVFVSPGIALKKYPCIYALHRPIDGLLVLREKLALTPENVDFIECRVAPGVFRPLLSKLPATGLEAKFSMDYVLAVAALDGRYDLAAFEDPAATRPILQGLYPRTRKIEDPRCLGDEQDAKSRSAGTLGFVEVTVRRKDGAQETLRVDKPRGSPEKPLTWDEIREKFLDCAHHAGLPEPAGPKLFEAWRAVATAARIRPMIEMLAKG
jgi:2-methylcitrate dehydratase PrpD